MSYPDLVVSHQGPKQFGLYGLLMCSAGGPGRGRYLETVLRPTSPAVYSALSILHWPVLLLEITLGGVFLAQLFRSR